MECLLKLQGTIQTNHASDMFCFYDTLLTEQASPIIFPFWLCLWSKNLIKIKKTNSFIIIEFFDGNLKTKMLYFRHIFILSTKNSWWNHYQTNTQKEYRKVLCLSHKANRFLKSTSECYKNITKGNKPFLFQILSKWLLINATCKNFYGN